MNTIIRVVMVSFALVCANVSAQEFQGEATYKSKRKIDIKLDSTQMATGMADQMMEMLKKQFEKTYILDFNKEESIYKEEEALSAPNPQGMNMVMVMSGGSDVLYKNIKGKRYTNQNESFSKLFLIKDDLEDIEWKLESETRNIGDYTCFKATTTREVEVRESGISFNGDKDLSTTDKEPIMQEITITAWYTPQIPVSVGPGNYHGLPGLILEVNDGSETVICSKIVINPKKASKIVEPEKGKELTQDAYDKIMEKKMKEMDERMRSNNRRGDGENIEIRIGG
ncbi:MAG: GLPGLI family protein [Psychroserpens sp.]|uniref:GLPGLI family protein n=1 Tax=Psychroserpens sp. TaxID=2020870 RepID=UPI0030033A7E